MTAPDLSRAIWRKSSRSGGNGDCVEVATVWRKSRRSNGTGGECVEVAGMPDAIAVRDSKDPDGPKLAFDSREWDAFVRRVRSGVYDPTG